MLDSMLKNGRLNKTAELPTNNWSQSKHYPEVLPRFGSTVPVRVPLLAAPEEFSHQLLRF